MKKIVVATYLFLSRHKCLYWCIMIIMSVLLAVGATRLHYSEDIASFMPFNEQQQKQFTIYQEQAQAQTITLLFDSPDEEQTIDAIDTFASLFHQNAEVLSHHIQVRTTIDPALIAHQIDSAAQLIPFLLTSADYAHIDSALTTGNIKQQLQLNRTKLLMPQSGLLQPIISTDPLNLFSSYLRPPQQAGGAFDLIDGYIFSADHSRAIAFIDSPFGSSETGQNAKLVDAINQTIHNLNAQFPDVNIHAIGAPMVSVSNAKRIKLDSIITISIALILISFLLFYSVRRKRDILYMLLTIAFGMLFALGTMSLFTNEISIIVLGISSVIVGIAVNYPLHLIVHRDLRTDMVTTLQEVISPLVVGNITTVGAFLCLVPLQAKALHDLGLFSALMLVGTILFTIFFLPQLVERQQLDTATERHTDWIDHLAELQPHKSKMLTTIVIVLTIVLAFFAPNLSFDSNLNNINYMTDQQRNDVNYFLNIAGKKNTQTVYIVREISDSRNYLDQWNIFWTNHSTQLDSLRLIAADIGFKADAFTPFFDLINYKNDNVPTQINQQIEVEKDHLQAEKTRIQSLYPDAEIFDIQTLNSQLTNTLSDNFDYIGLVCSLIVFIFLCINLRSVWLGLIAFTPMLIAWVWILGIMYLLGIQFNIVNIILATFIFGQGDDYTIFITEGLIHEHQTGQPILAAYKRSIILSALIMFAGIGVLVVAQHPAMRSLGIVTILGMCGADGLYHSATTLQNLHQNKRNKQYQIRSSEIG